MLFNRTIKTNLPESKTPTHTDKEVHKRDKDTKTKMKSYADRKSGAKKSKIKEGDYVLMKQPKSNEFSTPYKTVPYRV